MLVDFKTAKLAKEKGFPQHSTHKGYGAKGSITRGKLSHYSNHRMVYAAPTIFELQQWLLEKHGVWVETQYGFDSESFSVFAIAPESFNLPIPLGGMETYTDPFKALKKELINALKLIE